MFNYEKKDQPLASHAKFGSRLAINVGAAALVITAAMMLGMAGYGWFEGMDAVDAFANSAMILSGMGPLSPLLTTGGKIFAGLYAIFCGLLFFGIAALVLAPVLHRVLHIFHVNDK
jgi:hypothetical protein